MALVVATEMAGVGTAAAEAEDGVVGVVEREKGVVEGMGGVGTTEVEKVAVKAAVAAAAELAVARVAMVGKPTHSAAGGRSEDRWRHTSLEDRLSKGCNRSCCAARLHS